MVIRRYPRLNILISCLFYVALGINVSGLEGCRHFRYFVIKSGMHSFSDLFVTNADLPLFVPPPAVPLDFGEVISNASADQEMATQSNDDFVAATNCECCQILRAGFILVTY